ncbi:MAG: TetR/AcrR family transcriptional regulator [Candidatus Dormibacteria bacterium]
MPKIAASARSERRQRLITAAWECAGQGGYRNLTVDQVCLQAGVSKGAFYVYFSGKQELLLALLAADSAYLDDQLRELDESPLSTRERLRQFTRTMLARGDDPGRVQVRADIWTAMITEEAVRVQFLASVEGHRSVLRRWIRRGIDSGELAPITDNALASILLALSDGLLLHGGLGPAGFRWENVRGAVDILLDGLTTTEAPLVAPRVAAVGLLGIQPAPTPL